MKKQYIILFLLVLTITTSVHAQNDSIYFWKSGQLIAKRSIKPADVDTITFKRPVANLPHVTICNQIWSTKNLDVSTYSDGTPIPQITDPTTWANFTTGAWCYYNNDPANGAIYGKLYNWYAAAGIYNAASLNNPALRKNLAPDGWHVPSNAEWTTLTDCLGGTAVAADKLRETGTVHWPSPNIGATNSSGFTALPGGYRDFYGLPFLSIGSGGKWWSSSQLSSAGGFGRDLHYLVDHVGGDGGGGYSKAHGMSVRCIKD
jgi:uncharacterized protein (TIGR02145 family)